MDLEEGEGNGVKMSGIKGAKDKRAKAQKGANNRHVTNKEGKEGREGMEMDEGLVFPPSHTRELDHSHSPACLLPAFLPSFPA